jgi:hypothetical protein
MAIRAGALIDVADFADGGWVTLTLLAGFAGTLAARRRGDQVTVRGLVTPSTNWGAVGTDNTICNSVPSDLIPPTPFVGIMASSAAAPAMTIFRVGSNGASIGVRCGTATHTGGVYINYDYLSN